MVTLLTYSIIIRSLGGNKNDVTSTEKPTRVTLPYIQGISEAIRRVLGTVDIGHLLSPQILLKIFYHTLKTPYPCILRITLFTKSLVEIVRNHT